MKTKIAANRGSSNVFADLGLCDAEKLKIKSGLVIQIEKLGSEQSSRGMKS